jgi:hypothetical protein
LSGRGRKASAGGSFTRNLSTSVQIVFKVHPRNGTGGAECLRAVRAPDIIEKSLRIPRIVRHLQAFKPQRLVAHNGGIEMVSHG